MADKLYVVDAIRGVVEDALSVEVEVTGLSWTEF